MVCILLASAITVISCQGNDEVINTENTEKLSAGNSISSRVSQSEDVKVEYGSKRFEINNDHVVSYFDTSVFQYDAVLADSEMNIQDNLSSNGEIIVTNPITKEKIIFYNFRETQTENIFDVKTSGGHVFAGMTSYTGSSASRMMVPIVSIIRAIGAIAVAVGVLVSSNQSQAGCQAALGNLHCPKGSSPYMTYESGWFSSSCQVGCH